MNILFYHNDETCPTMGGIQRTTALIAENLTKKYGYRCFNVYDYSSRYPLDIPRYQYVDSKHLSADFSDSELATLIDEWEIDIIINQQMIEKHEVLYSAIEMSSHKCRLIYCHHTTPKRLFNYSLNHLYLMYRQSASYKTKIKLFTKMVSYPLYSRWKTKITLKRNGAIYRKIYNDVTRFVLLSHNFEAEWRDVTGLNDTSKLDAIPNMLSFDSFLSYEKIKNKEKKILLVARLVEFPKNITSALRIWKRIACKEEYSDWSFDIVGHGRDEIYLKEYVKKHKIPRVNFLGRQNSEPYYSKSSIFIMTSIREGWSMTITESIQKGTVPIAFDSFASIHDIIQDGKNGFLVKSFDENEFVRKLEYLMTNDEIREKMAMQAIESSKQFLSDKVIAQWHKLLTEVMVE